MDYSQFEIFRDITDREVEAMIRCFHMRQDAFQPGETICTYGDGGQEVGVVVEGEAELVRFDLAGARTILERLEEGSVFGEALAFTAQLGDCVEVVCARPCRVLFMEYAHIMKRCEKACLHHSKLVHNMFRLVSQQTQPPGGGPLPPQHPGQAPVLLPDPPSGDRLGQLHPALYPQRPGRLHQHRPQRHDAGAQADAGGGPGGYGGPPGHSAAPAGLRREEPRKIREISRNQIDCGGHMC